MNCPKFTSINQTINCILETKSHERVFHVLIDFGDGDSRAFENLTNFTTLPLQKVYRKPGVYVINANVTNQNMNVNPIIRVSNYFAYDSEQLVLNCSENRLISLTNAFYGRAELNCTDTLAFNKLNAYCANKTNCSINVPTGPLFSNNCPGVQKYLTFNLECLGKYDDIIMYNLEKLSINMNFNLPKSEQNYLC